MNAATRLPLLDFIGLQDELVIVRAIIVNLDETCMLSWHRGTERANGVALRLVLVGLRVFLVVKLAKSERRRVDA